MRSFLSGWSCRRLAASASRICGDTTGKGLHYGDVFRSFSPGHYSGLAVVTFVHAASGQFQGAAFEQKLMFRYRWETNDSDSGSVIGDVHLLCQPDGNFLLRTLGRYDSIRHCTHLH